MARHRPRTVSPGERPFTPKPRPSLEDTDPQWVLRHWNRSESLNEIDFELESPVWVKEYLSRRRERHIVSQRRGQTLAQVLVVVAHFAANCECETCKAKRAKRAETLN